MINILLKLKIIKNGFDRSIVDLIGLIADSIGSYMFKEKRF